MPYQADVANRPFPLAAVSYFIARTKDSPQGGYSFLQHKRSIKAFIHAIHFTRKYPGYRMYPDSFMPSIDAGAGIHASRHRSIG